MIIEDIDKWRDIMFVEERLNGEDVNSPQINL